ncbi:hypothetical protein GGR55DRAFT_687494 [Xylaria sp. FL0064]|nr:hypothetical protein GGR55DRAFT_687494 [Xylaria sp. FL0064]
MSIAPPAFLPVLFGYGSFVKDSNGKVKFDDDGKNPLYVIPPSDAFLEMKPSKESQQFWPVRETDTMPKKTSVVLFSIVVNTHCEKPDVITEIGYTIYDMATIYDGAKGSRKKRIPGCQAPGPRGENITRLALSRHFIVEDTGEHHPGTCKLAGHIAQPYYFTYRKSGYISRENVQKTVEEAFEKASNQGLTHDELKEGQRRAVILLGWGNENLHPQIKATSWFEKKQYFQQWDVRRHPTVLEHIPNPTYITCLDVFGIQHRANDKEVGHNAGNNSAFTVQLLIALCFLTQEQRVQLKAGKNLEPTAKFPGVESVLARDNRPPGSEPLPPGRVPILH